MSTFLRRTDLVLLRNVSSHRRLRVAARETGVTPAAATRRIAALSAKLGTALVVRERGHSRLTAGGWLLYRSGGQLLDVLDHAVAQARRDPGAVSRLTPLLRLAAGVGEDPTLVDLLAAWLPGIVVDLLPGAGGEAFAFEQYRVDAACCWGLPSRPFAPRRPAHVLPVVCEPLWVALPAAHPLAGRATLAVADLGTETWIVPRSQGQSSPSHHLSDLSRQWADGGRRGRALAATSVANQRSLVAQGQGVAIMSPLAAPRRADAGFVLRPVAEPVSRKLYLAVDPVTVPPPVAQRLRSCLRAHYAEAARRINPEYAQGPHFPVPAGSQVEPSAAPVAGLMLQRIRSSEPEASEPAAAGSARLEPEHLHLLAVVDEAGSVNRAAGTLMVTQPALTRRLRRLERSAGIPLLHTSPRGSRLSGEARLLLAATQAARTALDELAAQLRYGYPDAARSFDIAT